MRESFTAEFKARIVLEILREEKTTSQFIADYGVRSSLLGNWKKAAIAGLSEVLAES